MFVFVEMPLHSKKRISCIFVEHVMTFNQAMIIVVDLPAHRESSSML